MSGIISGVDYGLLFGNSDAPSTDLLSILYSGTAGSGAPSVDPLTAMKLAKANETRSVAQEAKDPTTSRDVAAFKKGISDAKTIQDALSNPQVLQVLLTANNLGGQVGFPALAEKALMSDPTDSSSLASKLSSTNSAWLDAAKTYDFAKNGLAKLQDPSVQQKIIDAYVKIQWETSLDQQTPGLSSAMQFQSNAASITNVYQILGDAVNRDVVLTALNIPLQVAYQPLEAQANAITSRLDVGQLQNTHFVETLTQRYLLNKNQASSASSASGVTSLFA